VADAVGSREAEMRAALPARKLGGEFSSCTEI
jgi:hypothetical protein